MTSQPRQRMVTLYCELCAEYKQATAYHKVCEGCLGRKCKCARIKGTAKADCSLCKKQHVGGCLTWVCDDHQFLLETEKATREANANE